MITKEIFIQYSENGVNVNPFSVAIGSEDNTFGIKELATGSVIVPAGASVSNPSDGLYSYLVELQENTIYIVSWKIEPNSGDPYKYVVQQIGPFSDGESVRAVTSTRGVFVQGNRVTLFIKITDINGNAQSANTIAYSIVDSSSNITFAGTPEQIDKGFYLFDWSIPENQAVGDYIVSWSYQIAGGSPAIEQQGITISAASDSAVIGGPYDPRIVSFRISLTAMLRSAQSIPVYREKAITSIDHKTFMFTFQRWNQSAGIRIFRNKLPLNSGFTVDYFRGMITFDQAQLPQDNIEVSYNFRWFSDEELDRFMSTAINYVNLFPTSTGYSLMSVPEKFIPLVLWGSAIEALRHLMLDISFQEPAIVFGTPEMQEKAFSRFQALKENYEEMYEKGLEQKKYGPYVGLTATMVTPEYTLPGGRSRWFRYLFSSGGG